MSTNLLSFGGFLFFFLGLLGEFRFLIGLVRGVPDFESTNARL